MGIMRKFMLKPSTQARHGMENNAPVEVIDQLYIEPPHSIVAVADAKGLDVRVGADFMDIIRGDDIVRIAIKHFDYSTDIVASFDYYFSAVKPVRRMDRNIVDYASPRYHQVVGFDLQPIMFPSLAEPVVTTRQYLAFAGLEEGMTAIDLGAYSGLGAILFSEAVGKTGRVVAVDADAVNIECIKQNFSLYQKIRGTRIDLLEGAVWENDDGLDFSTEGNMGASAVSIVGANRGKAARVASYTLSSIAKKFALEKIDFIKCDVEGAEKVIFTDKAFFARHLPRIIIETHLIGATETTDKCISDLSAYGYECRKIIQTGVPLPLLECHPPAR